MIDLTEKDRLEKQLNKLSTIINHIYSTILYKLKLSNTHLSVVDLLNELISKYELDLELLKEKNNYVIAYEANNMFKTLIEYHKENKQKDLDKLFKYFYDQIDPIKSNGEVNSKLEKIESVDNLIDYYENEMIVTIKR